MPSPYKPRKPKRPKRPSSLGMNPYTGRPPYPLNVSKVEYTRKGKPIITQTTEQKDDSRSD